MSLDWVGKATADTTRMNAAGTSTAASDRRVAARRHVRMTARAYAPTESAPKARTPTAMVAGSVGTGQGRPASQVQRAETSVSPALGRSIRFGVSGRTNA